MNFDCVVILVIGWVGLMIRSKKRRRDLMKTALRIFD